jgi:sugar phosphate isomerase/epimerase
MAAVRGAGFSTWVSGEGDFGQLRAEIDKAAALGMEFTELPIFMLDVIAGARIIPQQLRRLKEATADGGVGYTAHGPIALDLMTPPDVLPRHMAVAKANIEVAAEIRAVHLVLHTGQIREPGPDAEEAAYAQQRECLRALGELAASRSVILAVENVMPWDRATCRTALPSRLAREIETIGHPNVRACLDVSHAAIQSTMEGVDFFTQAKAIARVARHVHVHDSFGDPYQARTFARSERVAFGMHDLHLPLGWGSVPWRELMEVTDFEPDVIFNLELPAPYRVALAESVETMRGLIASYAARRG